MFGCINELKKNFKRKQNQWVNFSFIKNTLLQVFYRFGILFSIS